MFQRLKKHQKRIEVDVVNKTKCIPGRIKRDILIIRIFGVIVFVFFTQLPIPTITKRHMLEGRDNVPKVREQTGIIRKDSFQILIPTLLGVIGRFVRMRVQVSQVSYGGNNKNIDCWIASHKTALHALVPHAAENSQELRVSFLGDSSRLAASEVESK
ncbi:hypothetical protein G7Z17_g31 [Cylindrodendrum hubeiense]|uniref:Uncharacterized protein n=1 Tax=Cylindrodendrum hubeiense TaxID=595255 RepID=A0A9P5HID8_9HYPO|nr:hypothetical protein G7Z17_g31 [Cylindrodendrum hubeiense]